MTAFDGVKTFTATKFKERELLGELITDWIRTNPDKVIVDKIVTQSSDDQFHCLTITLFYKFVEAPPEEPEPPPTPSSKVPPKGGSAARRVTVGAR